MTTQSNNLTITCSDELVRRYAELIAAIEEINDDDNYKNNETRALNLGNKFSDDLHAANARTTSHSIANAVMRYAHSQYNTATLIAAISDTAYNAIKNNKHTRVNDMLLLIRTLKEYLLLRGSLAHKLDLILSRLEEYVELQNEKER